MKRILFIPAILLMMAGNFYSCGLNEKETDETEIEIAEYSLSGTDCQWTNHAYDDKVIVINSESELEKYIACTEGKYPEIDFSKYTLLFAHDSTSSGVYRIDAAFFQNTTNRYTLKVTVHLDFTAVVVLREWHISILVPKISNNAKIVLDDQYTHY